MIWDRDDAYIDGPREIWIYIYATYSGFHNEKFMLIRGPLINSSPEWWKGRRESLEPIILP